MKFQPVKTHGNLSERVSRQLEEAILSGKVRALEQLPTEASLVESFGVSRTVVREAVKRLEARGLVESHVGTGSFVAPYPVDQIKLAMERFIALNTQQDVFLHLLDLRRVIEVETAERLAKARTKESLAAVAESIDRLRRSKGRLEEFAQADMDFHLAIAGASNNPFFASILEPLKNTGRAFGLATYEGIELLDRVIREHQKIYDAICAGDAPKARLCMVGHIEFSRTHYEELLRVRAAAAPQNVPSKSKRS